VKTGSSGTEPATRLTLRDNRITNVGSLGIFLAGTVDSGIDGNLIGIGIGNNASAEGLAFSSHRIDNVCVERNAQVGSSQAAIQISNPSSGGHVGGQHGDPQPLLDGAGGGVGLARACRVRGRLRLDRGELGCRARGAGRRIRNFAAVPAGRRQARRRLR
jgi:hypothetical protein